MRQFGFVAGFAEEGCRIPVAGGGVLGEKGVGGDGFLRFAGCEDGVGEEGKFFGGDAGGWGAGV